MYMGMMYLVYIVPIKQNSEISLTVFSSSLWLANSLQLNKLSYSSILVNLVEKDSDKNVFNTQDLVFQYCQRKSASTHFPL